MKTHLNDLKDNFSLKYLQFGMIVVDIIQAHIRIHLKYVILKQLRYYIYLLILLPIFLIIFLL